MSAGVINSSILLSVGFVVGIMSLVVQTLFWPRADKSTVSGTISAIGEIWKEIVESITIWNPSNPEYKSSSFVRMSVTLVLMLGLVGIILATYDSVNSFWIYFVLYVGVAMLAFPIVGHMISWLFRRYSSNKQMYE